jgi:hypothetical protein
VTANAVGKKATQVSALSRETPIFFGRKTLESMRPRAVKHVADRGKRGAWRGRFSVGRRRREKTWEVQRPMRASGPDLD